MVIVAARLVVQAPIACAGIAGAASLEAIVLARVEVDAHVVLARVSSVRN
jgi:hypothetical protein